MTRRQRGAKLDEPKRSTMKTSKHPCGFCSTNTHSYCRGVVVNGDGVTLVKCPCGCDQSQQLRCVLCENKHQDGIDPELYTCIDTLACVSEFNRQKAEALGALFPNGIETKEKPKGSECNCGCGNFTSGGLFKPGHADKLVAGLARDVKAGAMSEDDAREMLLHLSEGLIKKLDARL
jgi:hypothetical protein